MNGSPPRLDLSVERARRAVGLGCLVAIDSDAHDIRELDYVRWGDQPGAPGVGHPGRRAQHAVARRPPGLGGGQAGGRL